MGRARGIGIAFALALVMPVLATGHPVAAATGAAATGHEAVPLPAPEPPEPAPEPPEPAPEAGANTFKPLTPARLLDTRPASALGTGEVRNLRVAGIGGVPSSAVAVSLNVTVTAPSAYGWLSVFPAGGPLPGSSNLNFTPGLTVANHVMVGVGAAGMVSLFNAVGSTHLIVDVTGWFSGGFNPVSPTRFLDTRSPGTPPFGPGESRELVVAGRGPVPAGATAVALNVTVTGPAGAGFLTVYPGGAPIPTTSNVNFVAGQTVPNFVLVGVGQGGRVGIFAAGAATHVIVDVMGWFSGGFNPVVPVRLADTRLGACGLRLGHDDRRSVAILGRGGVPDRNVTAVAVNVTATSPTAAGFLTVYPKGTPLPGTSNLNVTPGRTVPNLVTTGVGPDGAITIANAAGTVEVLVDVMGWFEGTSTATAGFDCATLAATLPAPPGFAFGSGTFLVRSQVPPGRYVASGGPGCAWQRLRGLSGQPADVIAGGGGASHVIADLDVADAAFTSTGCGTWTAYVGTATLRTTFSDGDWTVSEDVLPGVYQSSAAGPCRWEQLMRFGGEASDRTDDGVSSTTALIELAPFEVGVRSRGCGTWRWLAPPTP